MPSSIYKYYPRKDGRLACIVCDYPYDMDAPLSTLKKHLRAKHNFSIRRPSRSSSWNVPAKKLPATYPSAPVHQLDASISNSSLTHPPPPLRSGSQSGLCKKKSPLTR
ncbi:hypothetical protein DSO57_1028209 [Entomophthora muscae]|uniref:Uncharacterized protein n=1 Tax=Entomophthora muscae TaxID=34485 RepID=A0ACC2T1G3_9FUNG|nr:hypothetical protein DSO57_1028209 [Entomophthora muscae]